MCHLMQLKGQLVHSYCLFQAFVLSKLKNMRLCFLQNVIRVYSLSENCWNEVIRCTSRTSLTCAESNIALMQCCASCCYSFNFWNIFTCLATESATDGSCDTSIVEEVINWIESPLILIKSTVSPGTTERLQSTTGKRIVFSREYIGESTYDVSGSFPTMLASPFFTFGGKPTDTKQAVALFTVIGGPNKIYSQTDAMSAELAKYMENCFLATKVVFCYEFDQICEAFGRDYNEVRELWLLHVDPRINPSHTSIFPGNKDPYSRKCLPKDLKAISIASTLQGYVAEFLGAVAESNKRIGNIRRKGTPL